MTTTPLSQIPTLSLLYKLNKLQPSTSPNKDATSKYNDKISLIRVDITKLEVDSIVNAANESLLGGGGVDGAIHRAAGPKLVEECRKLDGCDTGSAKLTAAYKLPCKRVIHAVGPVYYSAKREGMHTTLLQGCYTTSLDLASENHLTSIAFSALSTGVYGYPSDEAAEAAIEAVKGWLDEDEERAKKMERIIFCSFMEKDEKAYEEFVPKFFPPSASESADDETEDANKTDVEDKPEKSEKGEAPLPDLPDVPTKEPAEEGQPEPKKAKLDD